MQLLEETAKHINDYALVGLRTLAVAKRDLTEEEYRSFVADHQAASQAMSDRDGRESIGGDWTKVYGYQRNSRWGISDLTLGLFC